MDERMDNGISRVGFATENQSALLEWLYLFRWSKICAYFSAAETICQPFMLALKVIVIFQNIYQYI